MKDYRSRATDILRQAQDRVSADCRQMHAEHSAKGLLASGSTAKRAVSIFQERMSEALTQILGEIAKIIEHRGREWSAAMSAVASALDEELSAAPALLEPSFRLARVGEGSAQSAAHALIDRASQELRQQLSEFSEGWTAPEPKRWSERHPLLYAVMLLVAGSLIGAMVTQILPG